MQKSELEKRFEPFYYLPEQAELEKKVLTKQPDKLRDHVKGIASGAAPKISLSEKYSAGKEDGIPFLRVQNLSPKGILEFEDCKYINKALQQASAGIEKILIDKNANSTKAVRGIYRRNHPKTRVAEF